MLPLRCLAIRCILAAALAASSLSWALADAPYVYTPLGIDFRPYRVSESGQVVGAAEFGRNPALLWRDGVVETLGPGAAHAMNNAGDIVISAPRASDGYLTAHLRHDGTTTPLPIPPWGSDFRHFYDMNSSSHIVGSAQERAFLWADNQLIYLDGTFGGQSSSAYAINDAGKVVGLGGASGFLWDDGAVTLLPDTAMDINNRDQVLLFSAVWENGTVTPLPLMPLLPGSVPESVTLRAEAINDRGQVVARQRELYFIDVESGYGARDRSYLWDPVLGARDLAELVGQSPHDWTFAIVTDINSAGQIVGWGHNGGFLLTPVPEPASVTLIACAAVLVARVGGRRARRRPAANRSARNSGLVFSGVMSIRRTFAIVAASAIAFHLGALKARAIEIVFGGNPGFNDSAIYYKDTDDLTSLASPIAGPLAGPILTNWLAYWEGKVFARTKTGPNSATEYEVKVDGTGFMPADSVPTRVAGYAFQGMALTLDSSAGY